MNNDIDQRQDVARRSDVARLARLEDGVWARIGDRTRRNRTLRRVAVTAVLVLVVGGVNGALLVLRPSAEPSEMRVFTVSAGLSPLSSLEDRG